MDNQENTLKPSYYKSGSMDVIAFCNYHGLGFCEGNIIKYITSAGKRVKNGVEVPKLEDLNKAKEYIERLISFETNKSK